MAGRVDTDSSDHWRARVDARGGFGLSCCAHSELREHRLQRRLEVRADACEHRPIPFDRFLHRENREGDSVRLRSMELPEESRPPLPIAQPRPELPVKPVERSAPKAEADPIRPRPDAPRLGDVSPVPLTRVEQRLRVVYRIELPLRIGHVIDVLI